MKQVIVLVAMIILGVGLATMVTGFEASAKTITTNAGTMVKDVLPATSMVDEAEVFFAA
ncbi:MAG: hypothetical protein IJ486_03865 [Firmicutes bacterium]|nr:hypothetical protein [Bacillota bacterium]